MDSKFNSSFNGYNIKEVNKFVDEMASEYSKMLERLKNVLINARKRK